MKTQRQSRGLRKFAFSRDDVVPPARSFEQNIFLTINGNVDCKTAERYLDGI